MRWILLAIVAGACRDRSAVEPAPDPAAPPAHFGSGAASGSRPSLTAPELDAPPGEQLTIAQAFEVEPIDRLWRAETETELRRRVPGANAIECHVTMCKLTLVGNERELAKQLDELETEASLRGVAESVLLTAPDKRDDGTITVRAYARFNHVGP